MTRRKRRRVRISTNKQWRAERRSLAWVDLATMRIVKRVSKAEWLAGRTVACVEMWDPVLE